MIFPSDSEIREYAAYHIKMEESGIVNEPIREAA